MPPKPVVLEARGLIGILSFVVVAGWLMGSLFIHWHNTLPREASIRNISFETKRSNTIHINGRLTPHGIGFDHES